MYTVAYRARAVKGDEWVAKFCMYFLMFYNARDAVVVASLPTDQFWKYVRDNYDTLPRGSERRYFRGEAGRASIQSLQSLGTPVEAFFTPRPARTLPEVRRRLVATHVVGFGEYFLIKWADLLENVFQQGISYDHLYTMLPKPPLKCLNQLWPGRYVKEALCEVESWIADMDDPFSGYRKCGPSEAETVACAIPSYLIKQKYQMGDDRKKYLEQLSIDPELVRLVP